MTYIVEKDQFRTGKGSREVRGVFALDEFIVFAVNDRHRYADLRQIVRRIVRLRLLHVADRTGERVKLIRRADSWA